MRKKQAVRAILSITVPGAVLLLALAVTSFVITPLSHPSAASMAPAADLTTIDPRSLVPTLTDFPTGTTLSTYKYVSTAQASHRNEIPLSFLNQTGREIGYLRDFQVPGYGFVEIETVRFRTHGGMGRAYSYFLNMLPSTLEQPATSVTGVGERSTLAFMEGGGFVEFMRGRYYVVITTIPATPRSVVFVEGLARTVDRRIRSYSAIV